MDLYGLEPNNTFKHYPSSLECIIISLLEGVWCPEEFLHILEGTRKAIARALEALERAFVGNSNVQSKVLEVDKYY